MNAHKHFTDTIAALIPSFATLTLSQINNFVGIIGGLLGVSYLLWKWNKEAKQ